MPEDMTALYEERAYWVSLESEIADIRKYAPDRGLIFWVLGVLERLARWKRAGVQAEIDEALAAIYP